jgi:AraC-like DNA-binding protein
VEKRDIIFVPNCVDFKNSPIAGSEYKYLWLSLDGEDFIKYFEDKPNYKKHLLNNINFDKIAYFVTRFLVETTQEILNELDMLGLILKILSLIETHVERKNEEEYVEKSVSILASNFENPNFKINSVAKELHLSHSWLCALFKKKQKTTMQQFLMDLRLSKASEMLINTHTSIKDISYLCGFNDALYFSYIFKKNIGFSPLDFRKKKRKN